MRAVLKNELVENIWAVAVSTTGVCWAWIHLARLDDLRLVPDSARASLVAEISIAWGSLIGHVQFAVGCWHCLNKISRYLLGVSDSQLMLRVESSNELRLIWM